MTRIYRTLAILVTLLSVLGASRLSAQEGSGQLVTFTTTDAVMEDDPRHQDYTITLLSPDGEWRMQLNYHADHMFGTFTSEDFDLAGQGRYFNYARHPHNDMQVYSFTQMHVTVEDEVGQYRVKADCHAGADYHFVVEGIISAPLPREVLTDSLGYARVVRNAFLGTYAIYAENERYSLAYGVYDSQLTGTFYRADMLRPELYDKVAGDSIQVLSATAQHVQDGDNVRMTIDILSADSIDYCLSMFNGPHEMPVLREETISMINDVVLLDLTEMYGCYQLSGQTQDYGVAIGLQPYVLEQGLATLTMDDFFLPYTAIIPMNEASNPLLIFDIHGTLQATASQLLLQADVQTMDGTLYHITQRVGLGAPEVTDTVDIDFGHVTMLDYTQGMGVVGLGGSVPGKYQLRVYLQTNQLEGDFVDEEFYVDDSDIMVVSDGKLAFHDARYIQGHMERQGKRTHISLDFYARNDVLYRCTLYLDDLSCMHDSLYVFEPEDVDLVGLSQQHTSSPSDYAIQLQSGVDLLNENSYAQARGCIFTFIFAQDGKTIAGDYGYSDYSLTPDNHFFYENGCEVRVAPVAGQLHIRAVEPVTLTGEYQGYHTWVYRVEFQFVGQNGVIYQGQCQDYLVCLDQFDRLVELEESVADGIARTMQERGRSVRKVYRNGHVILELEGDSYDVNGVKINTYKP